MTTQQAIAIAEEYDRQVSRLEDDMVRLLDKALRAGFDQLESQILLNYGRFAAASPFDNRRQREITRLLGESLTLIDPDNAIDYMNRFERMYAQTSRLGRSMARDLIRTIDRSSTIQGVTGVNVAAVAEVARESWRDLRRYGSEFADSAVSIIGGNIAAGGSRRTAVTALRGRLGLTARYAETMVRTRTMSALNNAANRQYEDDGLKSQWLAVGDERMCPHCGARNMKVYEPRDIRLPAHHRCRCVAMPWSAEWAELGLTSDEFAQDYYDEGIATMRAAGNEPDESLTPFERAAGLTQVPRIFWAPGQPIPSNLVRIGLSPPRPTDEDEEDEEEDPGIDDDDLYF